jgi:hypothetical protein
VRRRFETRFPSNPIAMRMQGFGPGLCFTGGCTKTVQQWNADFTAALLALLGPRFAGIVRVEIIDGPQQCPPPLVLSGHAASFTPY